MRYLGRTHGVSVAWLYERFGHDDVDLVYEDTARMCADIFTKAFKDEPAWTHACWLINIGDVEHLRQEALTWNEPPPTQAEQERCCDTWSARDTTVSLAATDSRYRNMAHVRHEQDNLRPLPEKYGAQPLQVIGDTMQLYRSDSARDGFYRYIE